MAEEDNVLKGGDAFLLLNQGKEAWNNWADDNPGAMVDFSGNGFSHYADLSGLTFPGGNSFESATFKKGVDFSNSIFLGFTDFEDADLGFDVFFSGATFYGEASFENTDFQNLAVFTETKFNSPINFRRARLEGEVSFAQVVFGDVADFKRCFFGGLVDFLDASFNKGSSFEDVKFKENATFASSRFYGITTFRDSHFSSALDLEGTRFASVPDFRLTVMAAHLSLHGVKVEPNHKYKPNDEALYCRMKELAASALDHDREQYFFAHELKAARLRQSRVRRIPGYLYQWCSDFGRSISRPSLCLIGVWLISAAVYAWPEPDCPLTLADFGDGLVKSTSVILPFLAASRATLSTGFDGWHAVFAFAEGLLGLVFIFLIGLALRNRFRI